MIEDLRALADLRALSCDVCVVGAGATGIAIARELAGTDVRVVLLESGGEQLEEDTQKLYDADISGLPYVGHWHGRYRVLGGTTTRWGGQALPLTPSDFAVRTWIPHSGWPIEYADLAPYYARAAQFMRLDDLDYDVRLAAYLRARLPAFDPAELHGYFAKWSPQPNMATQYASLLHSARNVRILLHANVVTIRLDQAGAVASVHARTLEQQSVDVHPRQLVLAAGGLETARLLLANNAQRAAGIGNEHDLVGRFLQDHPGGRIGLVTSRDDRALQRAFNVYLRRSLKYTVRVALSPELQRREQVASASGTLMFMPQPGSALESLKEVYRLARAGRFGVDLLRHGVRSAVGLPSLARSIVGFARGRMYTPNSQTRLIISCEQEPNPESRVRLAARRDALGMPLLDISWRLTELTRRTAQVFARVAKREIERLGVGEVTLDEWLFDAGADWTAHLGDHNHHIGTTRMDPSPTRGVVDTDCRVHGVPNLYVASSAVFPTSGHSNPTLTALALAIRLADRLRTAQVGPRASGGPTA